MSHCISSARTSCPCHLDGTFAIPTPPLPRLFVRRVVNFSHGFGRLCTLLDVPPARGASPGYIISPLGFLQIVYEKGCFVRKINCCKDRSSHFCLGKRNCRFAVRELRLESNKFVVPFFGYFFSPCSFGTSFNGVGSMVLAKKGISTPAIVGCGCASGGCCAAAAGLVGGCLLAVAGAACSGQRRRRAPSYGLRERRARCRTTGGAPGGSEVVAGGAALEFAGFMENPSRL